MSISAKEMEKYIFKLMDEIKEERKKKSESLDPIERVEEDEHLEDYCDYAEQNLIHCLDILCPDGGEAEYPKDINKTGEILRTISKYDGGKLFLRLLLSNERE